MLFLGYVENIDGYGKWFNIQNILGSKLGSENHQPTDSKCYFRKTICASEHFISDSESTWT